MKSIYILELKENKFYIGSSSNPSKRIKNHFTNKGSKWTQIHKPTKIFKIFQSRDIFDEDLYTKKMMYKHGIDNVRGGSYSTIKLTEEQITLLQREFATADDKCFTCFEDHLTNKCTQKFTFGKYKDALFDDVCNFDTDYIKWLTKQDFIENNLKQILLEKIKEDFRLCGFCEMLKPTFHKHIKNVKNIKNKCSKCLITLTYHSIPFLRCNYCVKHNLQRSKTHTLMEGYCCSCFVKL